MTPEEAGRWEGDTFVFDPPLDIRCCNDHTATMQRITVTSHMLVGDITRDEVIEALLDQNRQTACSSE